MNEMKRIECCFKCDHRHIGCHAECEEYIQEKAQREHDREEMFRGMKEFNDATGCEVERSRRAKKYIGKR